MFQQFHQYCINSFRILLTNIIIISRHIFVEINEIEILFSNYIFGLTLEDGLWKVSPNIKLKNNISILLFSTKMYLLLIILFTIKLYAHINTFHICIEIYYAISLEVTYINMRSGYGKKESV